MDTLHCLEYPLEQSALKIIFLLLLKICPVFKFYLMSFLKELVIFTSELKKLIIALNNRVSLLFCLLAVPLSYWPPEELN
jgi:hypothetical protein